MPTYDVNYIFSATQLTVIIYLVVIVFNVIFWIVDAVRGKPPSPEYASPPLPIVLLGLILGFGVALPISFASYALLQWLNPYLFILRVPVKVIISLGTCLLVLVAMDLTVVLIDRVARRRWRSAG
ncbi:MAG: hypothetical protein HYY21_10620 [Candidatus Tectomicrobia bacterium]|nr:hypothetical protein [Candidatus Tectomicrobia bacterium]